MIRVTSIEQTRKIEAAADESGYSYEQMMQSAGRAAADRALDILTGITEPRVTILVGAGNNGGDGLVAGLFLAQDNPNAEVRFYLLEDRDDDYTNTARKAELFVALASDDGDKRVLRNMVGSADLVIDALFGIGVRLPIQGDARKILSNTNRAINERRRAQPDYLSVQPAKTDQIPRAPRLYVLAIDCPSGVDCDTGELDTNTIHADETITFITAKQGQFMFPAAEAIGTLTVADIGIPQKLDELKAVTDSVVDSERVKEMLPQRGGNSHKGTYGRALVVAGSVNYVGAPALAAEAAYRSGAGLVTVGAPSMVVAALASSLREATWLMLPNNMGVVSDNAVDVLKKELGDMDAMLVGPGMGTEKATREFIEGLLQQATTSTPKPKRKLGFQVIDDDATEDDDEGKTTSLPPLVIDADGLNLLTEIDDWWTLLPENTILTPHPGEMARLCDTTSDDVQANRWQLARENAEKWNAIVILKGAFTVIAAPNGDFAVLPFMTDALATAGTGDILAGLIVGFLAQGLSAWEAALVAGYVHGLAGEIAGELGSRSVMAGDVLAQVGAALNVLDT